MLRNINWQSFLTGLIIIAAIYYIAVIIKYFVPGWKSAIKNKKIITPAIKDDKQTDNNSPIQLDDFNFTESIVKQLKEVTVKTAADKVDRSDQIKAIRSYLQKCLHLKGTAYAVAINNALLRDLKSAGCDPLTDSEIERIWMKE
jgi:hypothetical protein